MIIRMSNDLKEQKIYANGDELANIMGFDREDGKRILTYPLDKEVYVHSFDSPILMTDNYRISRLNPTLRDTLLALYESKPRIIEYDGVSTVWYQDHSNVWCPSIDTLLFVKVLRKIFVENYCQNLDIDIDINNIKRAIEIGCGSALLSKYLLAKLNLERLVINDINYDAVKCAMDNIRDHRAFFVSADGLNLLRYETEISPVSKKFDLIICNPPYVPRPDSMGGNPYEGIQLLNHLVHKGQRYLNKGGIIITNISSLAWDLIFQEVPEMKMNMIEVMKVPLKVNNILNNELWLDYLRKLGLKREYNNGYEYWQEINITMLYNE